MNIVDLLDDKERQNYRHAQTMGHVCGIAFLCLTLIGMGYPIVALACVGVMAFSSEYSREMEFSVTRSPHIIYYERICTAKMKWMMAFVFGLMLIAFVGPIFTEPIINLDKWSHRTIFMLVIAALPVGMWSRLVQDFCIHHNGIFINRQFYPWRDVAGISWEGENDNILIMDLKRETDSLPDIKQYRWTIPPEQKGKVEAVLTSRRAT